ncbi:MAG: amidohydrolase [Deltaproteobacteria bacterium]|nr:amidohydrolase [Deltaproteobacteria bacterium]
MAILCDNALVVTAEEEKPLLEGQQLVIDRGVIAALGKRIHLEHFSIDRRIDCTGRIVLPGLVNAHSHLTEILQRSMRDNVRMETWRGYRARTEEMAHLTAEEIGAAAELACGEMLKHGVTAVVDHFSTRPGLSVAKMKAILGAFAKTGIRGALAASLRDQDFIQLISSRSGAKSSDARIEEPWREEFLEVLEYVKNSSGTSRLMIAPSSPQNCSDGLLREVSRLAAQHDLGIHTHLLETRLQFWAARKLYRGSLVGHLRRLGFLSDRLSAAHGVWLREEELDLMATSGASIVHNPASNLKLGSGVAPVIKMRKHGVNVALGTDGGDTSDTYSIFDQMRLAAFLSRLTSERSEEWVTAQEALRMGTANGANAIPAWRGKIGKIKKGRRADLIILKSQLPLFPLNNIIHQLVFCEGGGSVDTVLVDGEVVVEEGRLTKVDEDTLVERVKPISKRMKQFYNQLQRRSDPAERTVRRLYQKAFRDRSRS